MEVKSTLEDKKVKAKSLLIEISIGDYLILARQILKSNQFQRKRIRGSKSIYSMLKADILDECVIPPIVLAYTKADEKIEENLKETVEQEAAHFVILDGLQRSYTLLDIETEVQADVERHGKFLKQVIRCEIYHGINRLGILYRMLTLNTGQTAMSLRHQIEIMYLDLIDENIAGVKLVREADNERVRQKSDYSFKDMVEGFNSYIERSESPLDRGDVLENIASLENLAKENSHNDLFNEFVAAWNRFILKVDSFELVYPEDDFDLVPDDDESDKDNIRRFATTGLQAYKRPGAVTGFGAAIGLLKDEGEHISFSSLECDQLIVGISDEDYLYELDEAMRVFTDKAKKIGSAQRLYFRQFFKLLFWRESGCYRNMYKAHQEAFKSTLRMGI
jgi:hypothetical protein